MIGRDVQKMAKVLENVRDWEGLAGMLHIDSETIKENCVRSLLWAQCYRRELVRTYCHRHPYTFGEDIAGVLEYDMKEYYVAESVRQLSECVSYRECYNLNYNYVVISYCEI